MAVPVRIPRVRCQGRIASGRKPATPSLYRHVTALLEESQRRNVSEELAGDGRSSGALSRSCSSILPIGPET